MLERGGHKKAPFREKEGWDSGQPYLRRRALLWNWHLAATDARCWLPRCHRASPSTALDKLVRVYRTLARFGNISPPLKG